MSIKRNHEPAQLDKVVFFGAFAVLLAVALPIILNPEGSAAVINSINTFILTKLGSFLYLVWDLFV